MVHEHAGLPGEPEPIAAIKQVLTEAFISANWSLFAREDGVPVPLPDERHPFDHTRPDVRRALTVDAFFVRAKGVAQSLKLATGESFTDYYAALTRTDGSSFRLGGSVGAGPVVRIGRQLFGGAGHGGSARRQRTENPGGGLTFGWTGDYTFRDHSQSSSQGNFDISILTDSGAPVAERAHLVVRLRGSRQPVSGGIVRGVLSSASSLAPASDRQRVEYVIVENAAELFMSPTLAGDIADPARLRPAAEPARHIERADAAFATGYQTFFGDHQARFRIEHTPRDAGNEERAVVLGGGILAAIKAGLRSSGLVREEDLQDTSDAWRAVVARFSSVLADELRGVGMIHTFVGTGGTGRATVVVRGTPRGGFGYIRELEKGRVTVGGQGIRENVESTATGTEWSASAEVAGTWANTRGFVSGDVGVGYGRDRVKRATTSGVTRDVRRTQAEDKPDEFAITMDVDIDVYPRSGLRLTPAWGEKYFRTSPRPAVSVTTRPPETAAETAEDRSAYEGVQVRTVVPKFATREGPRPAPREVDQQVPAPANQDAFSTTSHPAPRPPEMIDVMLAELFLPDHFPALQEVADLVPRIDWGADTLWAPLRDVFANRVANSAARVRDQPLLPLDVTREDGAWLRMVLSNRNVRDNAAALFRDGLLVAPQVRLAARAGVLRPADGSPGAGSFRGRGLHFPERSEEPFSTHEKSGGLSLSGSLTGGALIDSTDPLSVRIGRQATNPALASHDGITNDDDWTSRSFSGKGRMYAGTLRYDLTGPGGETLTLSSQHEFLGFMLDSWGEALERAFPDRVVHPNAVSLPADPSEQEVTLSTLVADVKKRVAEAQTQITPGQVHLVADVHEPGQAEPFKQAAASLTARLAAEGFDGEVDLALVDHVQDPVRIRHYIYNPADQISRTSNVGAWRAGADAWGDDEEAEPGHDSTLEIFDDREESVSLLSAASAPARSATHPNEVGQDRVHADADERGSARVANALTWAMKPSEDRWAWQQTRSGFALAENAGQLAIAAQLPRVAEAVNVAIFQTVARYNVYVGGESVTLREVSEQIKANLTRHYSASPLWLIIHGTETRYLAADLADLLAPDGAIVLGTRGKLSWPGERASGGGPAWLAFQGQQPRGEDTSLEKIVQRLVQARRTLVHASTSQPIAPAEATARRAVDHGDGVESEAASQPTVLRAADPELAGLESSTPGPSTFPTTIVPETEISLRALVGEHDLEALAEHAWFRDDPLIQEIGAGLAREFRDHHGGAEPPREVPLTIAIPAGPLLAGPAQEIIGVAAGELDHPIFMRVEGAGKYPAPICG